MTIREHIARVHYYLLYKINKKWLINRVYRIKLHKEMNWKIPRDLNEKIQWLKLYSDTSRWSELADKYRVRSFIESQGFGDLLVPIYGHWLNAKDIDFDSLPRSFVLKPNNGSGDVIIVKDKSSIDKEDVTRRLNHSLKAKFGLLGSEFHYSRISPLIFAEKLLEQKESFSESLVDYKLWCLGGKVYAIRVYFNRTRDSIYIDTFDSKWNRLDGVSVFSDLYRDGSGVIPCPKTLDRMIEVSETLAKDFPQVRVDFYEVDGRLYFGELTFTSSGGFMGNFTPEFLRKMGDLVPIETR